MPVASKKTSSKKTPAKARRVARKVAPVEPTLPEARIAARERNLESRRRAEAEAGVGKSAARVEIYRLKNRATGQVRVLIDARGDANAVDLPWIVRDDATGVEVGYETRKELGANYAHVALDPPRRAPKAKARRVKK